MDETVAATAHGGGQHCGRSKYRLLQLVQERPAAPYRATRKRFFDAGRNTSDLAKSIPIHAFRFRQRRWTPGLQHVDTDPERSDEYRLQQHSFAGGGNRHGLMHDGAHFRAAVKTKTANRRSIQAESPRWSSVEGLPLGGQRRGLGVRETAHAEQRGFDRFIPWRMRFISQHGVQLRVVHLHRRAPQVCELVRQAERADVRPSWSGEALLAQMRTAAGASS